MSTECSEDNGWCGWCGACQEHYQWVRDTQGPDGCYESEDDEPKEEEWGWWL